MPTGIATAFETKVNELLAQWVNGVSQQFMTDLIPLALVTFTLYVTLLGWQIQRGDVHDPVPLIVRRLLMLAVVGALSLGGLGYYQNYVVKATTWATQGLVQEIATGGVSMTALDANGNPINFGNAGGVITLGNLIDALITTYRNLYNLLGQHFTSYGIPQWATILSAFFVALALFFVSIISMGFYILSRVELSLCLAVGPVFVLLAAFEATRDWTRRWIGQLWQYCVQIALLAACISMLQGMLIYSALTATQHYNAGGATSVFSDVLALFVLTFLVCVILWNIGDLARALTGAVGAIGHAQVQRTVLQTTRAAGRWMPSLPGFGSTHRGTVGSSAHVNEIAQVGSTRVPAAQQPVMDHL